jgi:hypothetical protein
MLIKIKIFSHLLKKFQKIYIIQIHKLLLKKIDLNNQIENLSFPIVDTINNNKYFNEDNYYRFENEFKYITQTEKLFKLDDDYKIYEFNKYSALYGCLFKS